MTQAVLASLMLTSLFSLIGASACHSPAVGEDNAVDEVVQLTFREFEVDKPAERMVTLFVRTREEAVTALYSTTADRQTGDLIAEVRWTEYSSNELLMRDWTACTESTMEPPGSEPTIADVFQDVIGPIEPPGDATIISADGRVWETQSGLTRLRIEEYGGSYLDRVVRVGTAKGFDTTIDNVSVGTADEFPQLRGDFETCTDR